MTLLRLFRLFSTADGRRYTRAMWWNIRHNHDVLHGGKVNIQTPTVTLTILTPDNRLRRVHNVPTKAVDFAIEHAARKGERVLIGEEAE